jgi:hypothetical protein
LTLQKKSTELARQANGSAKSFAFDFLNSRMNSHTPHAERAGYLDKLKAEVKGADLASYKAARKAGLLEAFAFARQKATAHTKTAMAALGVQVPVGMSATAPMTVAMASKPKAVPTITPAESPAFWDDMATKAADVMARGFTQSLLSMLNKAGEEGMSWGDFREALGDRVKNGVTAGRAYMTYHTCLNTGYSQFRYNAQAEVAKSVPNVQFVCMMLPTSRPEHMARNGIVVPFGSDYHLANQTPLDYNCYCQWVPVGDSAEVTDTKGLPQEASFGTGLPADRLSAYLDAQMEG